MSGFCDRFPQDKAAFVTETTDTHMPLKGAHAHNDQHITANRKAYAMWWLLAHIAGWNGKLQ